jgi:hypothetical protein
VRLKRNSEVTAKPYSEKNTISEETLSPVSYGVSTRVFDFSRALIQQGYTVSDSAQKRTLRVSDGPVYIDIAEELIDKAKNLDSIINAVVSELDLLYVQRSKRSKAGGTPQISPHSVTTAVSNAYNNQINYATTSQTQWVAPSSPKPSYSNGTIGPYGNVAVGGITREDLEKFKQEIIQQVADELTRIEDMLARILERD